MPKTPKSKPASALKKARELFSSKKSSDSDSSSSNESEEYSHIPITGNIPLLNKLKLSEPKEMDNISAQLQEMMKKIEDVARQQTQQDANITAINSFLSTFNTPARQSPVFNHNFGDLCKIPDPIKMLPTFDGNRRQLNAWLQTAEETLENFRDFVSDQQFKMYTTAVNNKILGRAKDILCLAGNPSKFEDIKNILITALGDRQELSTYKSQIWQLSMSDGLSVFKYFEKTKETMQNIKILAKQNQLYLSSWTAINHFIEQDALAAFIAGLEEPLFGYVQAARPKDLEDAYAFLCTFKSKEKASNNINKFKNNNPPANKNHQFPNKPNNFKPPFNNTNGKNPKPASLEQPMETESTKTRLTLNKRTINNNEIEPDPLTSESESEIEDLNVNFWHTEEQKRQT